MNRIVLTTVLFMVAGCSAYRPFSSSDYSRPHYEFPTNNSKYRPYDFQISVRSGTWLNAAFVVAGEAYGNYYIGWMIDDYFQGWLDPLKYEKISAAEWKEILIEFEKLNFYQWDVPCWEKGYAEDRTYFYNDESQECDWIIATGGGGVSFYAKTPEKERGVKFWGPMSDDGKIEKFAKYLLLLAGVPERKIPIPDRNVQEKDS